MISPQILKPLSVFRFPPFSTHRLNGGMVVYCVPDSTQDLVSLSLISKTGSTQETVPGQAALSAAMLTRGSLGRTANQLAEDVDMLGASLRSVAHRDSTGIAITGLAKHSTAMMDILSDCANKPAFQSEEFERLRLQSISDHEYSLSDPNYLAHRCFATLMFGDHPYARSRTGTMKSLSLLTVDQCKEFYQRVQSESQWFLIVAGNIHERSTMKLVADHFSTLQSTKDNHPHNQPVDHTMNQCGFTAYENAQQVVLDIGHLCISRHHEDFPALQLINTVFGGYFSSRLNALIREEKGFTYGIFSGVDSQYHASRLTTSCSVSAENVEETIDLIRKQWKRLSQEPIPIEELDRCKQFILGSFARSVETPQQVAQFLASIEEFDLQKDYYERFVRRIASLSADEVYAVQQHALRPDSLIIGASGKKADVEQSLSSVGEPIEIVVE